MQVAKSEVLCSFYYYCVGVGNVNSALYYGCCNKHIEIEVYESCYDFLHFFRRHLPVSYGNSGFGNHTVYHCFYCGQFRNSVAYKKHLPSACKFAVNGFRNNFFIEGYQFCVYGISVWRGCAYNRKVSRTHK